HPSTWQARQRRNVDRWLGCWEDVYTQEVVLVYQNLDAFDLEQIIGRPPQLTVEDVLKHRITLAYDARALDHDWIQKVLDFVINLMGIDNGGLMDHAPIIRMALSYIDPTMVQEILRSPSGASAQIYRETEADISSIMLGNPPQLRENDATAQM